MMKQFRSTFVVVLVVLAVMLTASAALAQDMVGHEVTGITIQSMAGEHNSVEGVAGDSAYVDGVFTVNFMGLTYMVTAIQYDGGMATAADAIPATVMIQRNPADDARQVAWYLGTAGTDVFVLGAPGPMSVDEMMGGNNLLSGLDNAFVNTGASVGETLFTGNQSIERIDYILAEPVAAGDDTAFAVFEHGPFDSHDAFGIAAITGLDDAGMPAAYGAPMMIEAGWGQPVLAQTPYFVLTNLADGSGGTAPVNPTLQGSPQQIGGILFHTADLVDEGSEVFGYSLVGPDVTCTAEEMVDVTAACYPTETGNEGGIDFAAVNIGALHVQAGE